MTLEEIWGALLCKKPDLKCPDATVIFKAKNLKKLLQQVYDKGVAAEKNRNAYREKLKEQDSTFDDFFKGFGKNRGKDFEQMMKDFF